MAIKPTQQEPLKIPDGPKPPDWDEFWAHAVAEKAKKKVLAYFGLLGAAVSLLLTLYGRDGIKNLLETRFAAGVEKKEKEATARVDAKIKEFEAQLAALHVTAHTKTEEYLRVLVLPPEHRPSSSPIAVQGDSPNLSTDIGAIGDQGNEGTTVGFSVAYALQAEIKKREGRIVQISARSIYMAAKRFDEWPGDGYEGTSVAGAMKALKEEGAFLESDWPYARKTPPDSPAKPTYRISRYDQVQDIPALKDALAAGRPVVVSINITSDFDKPNASGKVTVKLPLKILGGHSLCITSYASEKAEFTFANMWGTSWGNKGFGTIRDTDLQKIFVIAFTLGLDQ